MNYHTTRHQVALTRAAAANHTTRKTPRSDDEDAYPNDTVFPRIASITPRYNRIPTADGYIEKRGNRQMHVHFIDTPPQITRASRRTEEPPSLHQQPRRFHWLVFVGMICMVMLLGYTGLNAFGSWWHVHQDDSTYGRPRTFQTDAVIGHGDSADHPSHFIAMNLNRRVVIVEIPAGDISKTVIYGGPTLMGDGQDLTPVTLSFQDVNGDGRLDMLVHILDQTIVYLNNGTKFVASATSTADGGSNPPVSGGAQ